MTEFIPKKNDVLNILFGLYSLVVALMLGISANIIYDSYIKFASNGFKITIVICSIGLLIGLIFIINDIYIKPFYKSKNKFQEK